MVARAALLAVAELAGAGWHGGCGTLPSEARAWGLETRPHEDGKGLLGDVGERNEGALRGSIRVGTGINA